MTRTAPGRRHLLSSAGATLAVALAGCLDGRGTPVPGGADDGSDAAGGSDDDHDHDDDHELGHPESHVEVAMVSEDDAHHFVPHVAHVEEGGTVTWVLENRAHDTVAYHPDNADLLPSATEQRIPDDARPWASDLYRTEGKTFERTFEEEGIYDYVCTVVEHGHGPERGVDPHGFHRSHESTGMVGRVIVGWPELDADAQPALRSPADDLPDAAREELEGFNDRTRTALEHEDDDHGH